MDLPHDGYPRISSEGIELLSKGLDGDFSGWDRVPYLNHPNVLPDRCLSNAIIRATDEGHFTLSVWFGNALPLVKGMHMEPHIVFDRLDRMEQYTPTSPTVRLCRSDDWWVSVSLLKDDMLAFQGAMSDDAGSDAGVEEECPCEPETKPAKVSKPHVRTLEDFAQAEAGA